MTLKDMLKNIVAKQTAILDKAKAEGRVFTEDEKKQFDTLEIEAASAKAGILAEEKLAATNAMLNQPDPAQPAAPSAINVTRPDARDDKPFKNIAEQLAAVMNHARTGVCDERLLRVQNATGAAAGTGADGGFAIQKDFGGAMMESAVTEDPLLSLLDS
jgi:HK97 family phage major capsid protein